jgi:hypothetical protein
LFFQLGEWWQRGERLSAGIRARSVWGDGAWGESIYPMSVGIYAVCAKGRKNVSERLPNGVPDSETTGDELVESYRELAMRVLQDLDEAEPLDPWLEIELEYRARMAREKAERDERIRNLSGVSENHRQD